MMYVKKFIDRVALLDQRPGKDLIMPADEAKGLRNELAKLLSDKVEEYAQRQPVQPVVQYVQAPPPEMVVGGGFK